MILQLNPPIPVHVIGKGDGYAMVMIDYSQEHNIHWVCFIDDLSHGYYKRKTILPLKRITRKGESLGSDDS